MTDLLKSQIFHDETRAREWLEAHVWADGRVCPHCGNADQEKITKLEGKAHRPGVYQCNEPQCRQQFTVTVNTVFERSKIPLTKWLAALFLMTASKKGVSAHQVHRMLCISYKSTWFMMHRLREAMRVGGLLPPMGEDGGAVEVDETYISKIKGAKKKRGGAAHKNAVLSLLDRETGQVRSRPRSPRRNSSNIGERGRNQKFNYMLTKHTVCISTHHEKPGNYLGPSRGWMDSSGSKRQPYTIQAPY